MAANVNPPVSPMVRQLHEAYQSSLLSVAEILARSGIAIRRTTLLRKLKGLNPMTVLEYEALARVLLPTVGEPAAGRKRRVSARSAGAISPRAEAVTS